MKIKNILNPISVVFLATFIVFQFPLLGQCAPTDGSGSSLPNNSLESNSAAEVATLFAKLPERGVAAQGGFVFSPDGKYLTVISESIHNEIHIWDWRNGRLVRTIGDILGPESTPEPLLYTPNKKLLMQCGTKLKSGVIARIWNPETGEVVRDVEGQHGYCASIGFSTDGKLFFWATDPGLHPGDSLTAYSTETWRPVWGLRLESFSPRSLTVSPDGKYIALGGYEPDYQSKIVIIDIAQHAVTRTIQQPFPSRWGVVRLAWNPDSHHLAAGTIVTQKGSDAIKIFDVQSGETVAGETAEIAHIFALRYTPDEKYLIESGISIPTSSVTSLSDQQQRRELLQLRVATGPEGWDPVIRIWDGRHQRLLQEIPGSAGNIAITSDGHYLAMSGTGMIFIFELK